MGLTLAVALLLGSIPAFAVGLMTFASGPTGTAARSATFTPTDDAFVKDTRPNRNYGEELTLEVDNHPSDKRAFLRFHVDGIAGGATINQATLRLFVVDRSNQAGEVHAVEGAWSEDSVVWNNAPAVGAKLGKIIGKADNHTWMEADVTSAIVGDGDVDFVVTSNSRDGVDYSSSEAQENRPELVVEWAEASAPTPATPTPTVEPTPTPTSEPTATATPVPSPTPTATPEPQTSTGTTYYVDAGAGDDGDAGTSEATAWRTLGRASAASLAPGDSLLIKRGEVFTGPLSLDESGTADAPIVVGSYGSGAPPRITGSSSCVAVSGSYTVVREVHVDGCSWAGVKFESGAAFNTVEGSLITNNAAGVHVKEGASYNLIVNNTLADNNQMSVLTASPSDDDSGAFGVLLNGDNNEVAHNRISGGDAFSYDYGRDGAAVEIYGGQGNYIHHNVAEENHSFSELGNSRSRDNTFAFNEVRSSLDGAMFLVTRGAESSWGPVLNTRLHNNTVYLNGADSQGFVCHAGCDSSVLSMRNNVIMATWKAGYADGPFDEDYDLFYGSVIQFEVGPNSVISDPAFVDPTGGDLSLQSGSLAVDSGTDVGYSADLIGSPIPMDGDGDGVSVPDMGAFERNGGGGTEPAPTPEPTPAPTPTPTPNPHSSDPVIVAVGDIHGDGSDGDAVATHDLVKAIDPAAVLGLGDYQYSYGTCSNFTSSNHFDSDWGRENYRMYATFGPTHDWNDSSSEAPRYMSGNCPGQVGARSASATLLGGVQHWNDPYSFDIGAWHIIELPSICYRYSYACDDNAITTWLTKDLAAHANTCTAAFWHESYFTSTTSGHGPNNNVRPWVQALYDGGADVVLQGHNHDYERFHPQDPQRNADPNGLTAFVVGTGGIGFYSFTDTAPNSAARQSGSYGVLKLTLHASSFDWQFVPVPGSHYTGDSGSQACH